MLLRCSIGARLMKVRKKNALFLHFFSILFGEPHLFAVPLHSQTERSGLDGSLKHNLLLAVGGVPWEIIARRGR